MGCSMDTQISEQLTTFNQLSKELDEIYHGYAVSRGMSDTALWILWIIWDCKDGYTQRELSNEWHCSPQTINSALKGLEKKGLVELKLAPGSKKNKQIHLTDAGREFAQQVVEPLVQAERRAFAGLDEQERILLLKLLRKHTALLAEEINTIKQKSSEGL